MNNTITPTTSIAETTPIESKTSIPNRLSNTILANNRARGLVPITPDILNAALTDFARPEDLHKAINILKGRAIAEGNSRGAETFDWLMENQVVISRTMRSFLAVLTLLVATGLTINYAVKSLIPGYNFLPRIQDKMMLAAFSEALDSVFFPVIDAGSRIFSDPFLRTVSRVGQREKRELSRIKIGGKTKRKVKRGGLKRRNGKSKTKLMRKRSRRSRRTRRR